MRLRRITALLAALCLTVLTSTSASAQVFGTFTWQMQPYCNKVTLTLTTVPAGFTLDGSDDQCGANTKGAALGIGLFNPDGSVGLNFTIVTSPGGKGVQVSGIVSPANGQGTWTDSVGNSGAFVMFGTAPGLPARPLPASGVAPGAITGAEIAPASVGLTQIIPSQVQARVSGACLNGAMMTSVGSNGSVTCATPSAATLSIVEVKSTDLNLGAGAAGTRSTPACPQGYVVLSGGCSSSTYDGRVVTSRTLLPPSSYHFCSFRNEGAGTAAFVAYAVCGRIP